MKRANWGHACPAQRHTAVRIGAYPQSLNVAEHHVRADWKQRIARWRACHGNGRDEAFRSRRRFGGGEPRKKRFSDLGWLARQNAPRCSARTSVPQRIDRAGMRQR